LHGNLKKISWKQQLQNTPHFKLYGTTTPFTMPGRTNNGSIYEDDPEMDMAQVFDSIDIQSIELAFFVQSLNEEVPSSIV